jgi:flagellar biosynthetic protein FliR
VVVPTLGQFYTILVTLLFFALNGHLVLIEVLVDSFTSLPIGGGGVSSAGLWAMLSWTGRMFSGAMLIAIPAVAAMLLVNFGFGIMTRAAPQLNIFAIGFPIIMSFGFLVIYVSLPSVVPQFSLLLEEAYQLMRHLLTVK